MGSDARFSSLGIARSSPQCGLTVMPEPGLPLWQELTTREARQLAAEDPVVILPLAAVEQHGPALPLSTDLEIGLGILRAAGAGLPAGFPVRVLPTQAVGTSAEHLDFPGTLSLRPRSLERVILDLGGSLAGMGIRRLILWNSHGGNRATLDLAALQLRRRWGMWVVKATYTRFARPEGTGIPEEEWRSGLHGGAVETAMMLHLRPDLVRGEALGAGDPARWGTRVGPEGEAAFAWLAQDLHAEGVVGDARGVDAALGAKLVQHYASILAEVIMETRALPLEGFHPSGAE
jgi:creatinine amidohydrolase